VPPGDDGLNLYHTEAATACQHKRAVFAATFEIWRSTFLLMLKA
jgi:hypothetical protein